MRFTILVFIVLLTFSLEPVQAQSLDGMNLTTENVQVFKDGRTIVRYSFVSPVLPKTKSLNARTIPWSSKLTYHEDTQLYEVHSSVVFDNTCTAYFQLRTDTDVRYVYKRDTCSVFLPHIQT